MGDIVMLTTPENEYDNGKRKIKYLFKKGYGKKGKKLVVVFSAFPKRGTPPRYTYVKSLKEFNCYKLYISDTYGPDETGGSCYNLGVNGDFSIEEATFSLINKVLEDNNIKKENVIAIGSSKGGWMALYFGVKYGFGTIIAGAPQYLLGNYLKQFEDQSGYIKYIMGCFSNETVTFLNNLLPNVIQNAKSLPEIYIHIGEGDWHYKKHVKPLVEDLDLVGAKYILDIQQYGTHSEVGNYFIPFLETTLCNLAIGINLIEKLKTKIGL